MNRLPDERDMEQVVRSWMRDDDEHPADRNRQVGRIMGRVDETHQRRGAWRWLPFGRGTKRIDEDDEELFVAGGGVVAMRRGVSSAVALVAVAVLVVIGVAFMALLPAPVAGPGAEVSPSASAQPTIHPDDIALRAAFEGAWSGQGTSLADVRAVYAEDGVHSALWLDRVERFAGPLAIWGRVLEANTVTGTEWIPLPDAITGERRYLAASADDLNGIACVLWVEDALITRHDCILPVSSTGEDAVTLEAPSGDTLRVWGAMHDDFASGWASADRELIDRTVSPEIVHHVGYDNAETRLEGIDAYLSIMGYGGHPQELTAPVPLPAPAGEHRWTDYTDIAGGSLCTFWERDSLIIRHDCIVPTFTYAAPVDQEG